MLPGSSKLNSLLEEIAEEEHDEELGVATDEDGAAGVMERVEARAGACRALQDGLAPLERQVRAIFHHVVASRGEVGGPPAPAPCPPPPAHRRRNTIHSDQSSGLLRFVVYYRVKKNPFFSFSVLHY